MSVVRLWSFDLEQGASYRGVVSSDSIQVTEPRRTIVSLSFGNHDRNVSGASRFSRPSLDTHSRAREFTFPLDTDCYITAAR